VRERARARAENYKLLANLDIVWHHTATGSVDSDTVYFRSHDPPVAAICGVGVTFGPLGRDLGPHQPVSLLLSFGGPRF
jgi:hypothetical protein